MSKPDTLPVYFVTTAPQGWVKATLEKSIKELEQYNGSGILCGNKLRANQRIQWFNQTGVTPEMTHFTVIIPIHNEKQAIESVLNAVMLSNIPTDVRARFLLITNDCSDSSKESVGNFLEKVGKVEKEALDINIDDPKLNKVVSMARVGNLSFSHINTETAGKANALNIGNKMAVQAQDEIVMSVDADVYLEPDALVNMFASAYDSFYRQNNSTVMLWGAGFGEIRKGWLKHIISRGRGFRKDVNNSKVMGGFMAWRAEWLESIGGVPRVVIEDYAMGLKARKEGHSVKAVKESRIWVYHPGYVRDLVETYARFTRGGLQIIQQYPEYEQTVREERFEMKRFPERIREVIEWVKSDPKKLPFHLAYLLLFEYTIKKGQRDYQQNPNKQTWVPALSAK